MATTQPSQPSSETGLQSAIRSWLASWDFTDNPFGIWEAGREPALERYFVRRPFYEQLLTGHTSTLVFAPRGSGKSATRLMIQSECRPARSTSPTFAVAFTDFSPLVERQQTAGSVSFGDYLSHVLEIALQDLIDAVADSLAADADLPHDMLRETRGRLDAYMPNYLSAKHLSYLLKRKAPTVTDTQVRGWVQSIGRGDTRLPGADRRLNATVGLWQQLFAAKPVPARRGTRASIQIMQSFVSFAVELLSQGRSPCDAMFLLVDGID